VSKPPAASNALRRSAVGGAGHHGALLVDDGRVRVHGAQLRVGVEACHLLLQLLGPPAVVLVQEGEQLAAAPADRVHPRPGRPQRPLQAQDLDAVRTLRGECLHALGTGIGRGIVHRPQVPVVEGLRQHAPHRFLHPALAAVEGQDHVDARAHGPLP